MKNIFAVIPSPAGLLTIAGQDCFLTHLLFGRAEPEGYVEGTSELLAMATAQLEEYFAGDRKAFDIPLKPSGTDFQLRVWDALKDIPYGETCTYKDIALAVGCPKGYRAVGMANHSNPISIIVPCHRVIGHNGKLTGYGGGLETKELLLGLEKKFL